MSIRSLADINAAYEEGRWHSQRFLKGAAISPRQWACTEFASGQPPYQPRLGLQNTFTPCVMSGNNDIWYPQIDSGQQRFLHTMTLRNSQATYAGPASVIVYDLLGYYPLIDASVTDYQEFANPVALPRYSDGEGVQVIAVQYINGVASALVQGFTLDYVDSDGANKSTTGYLYAATSPGRIAQQTGSTAQAANASPYVSLGAGSSGVRALRGVQFAQEAGTFYVFYLVKPKASLTLGDQGLAYEKDFFMNNGGRMPEIEDGACLNFTFRTVAAAGTDTTWFGLFNFVWG